MAQIHQYTKHFPFTINNCSRKSRRLLRVIETLLPIPNTEFVTLAGHDITINLQNRNEKILYYFCENILRYYKQSSLGKFMHTILDENDLFVDIGAHLGFYSYIGKSLGAQVVCFEPEPKNCEFLERNPFLYDHFYPFALSHEENIADFYLGNDNNVGIHSLVLGDQQLESSDYARKTEVPVKRMDSVLTNYDLLEQLNLIKIDVEGAEEYVVKGMKGFLSNGIRPVIWCEVRGDSSGRNSGSYRRVISLLKTYGYQPGIFENGKIRRFTSSDICQVFDLVLTP